MQTDEDKKIDFDYDTYGGGVEYFGGLNSDDRKQILLKRRDDRTTTS